MGGATALRPDQAERLWHLVATYTGRLPAGVAEGYLARARAGPVHFAWAGDVEAGPGHPHYYRLTGPRLLIELDNTQHGANHVHSVLRDPEGDFGAGLL